MTLQRSLPAIALSFGLVGCGGGHTVTLTVTKSSTTPARSAGPTGSSATTDHTALPPATVPSKIAECSKQLQIGADGNAQPLLCSHGRLNTLAWLYFAKGDPIVLSLGPNAVPDEVLRAMCSDLHTSSIPIETSVYELASRYYGWSFGIDVSSEFPNACPTTTTTTSTAPAILQTTTCSAAGAGEGGADVAVQVTGTDCREGTAVVVRFLQESDRCIRGRLSVSCIVDGFTCRNVTSGPQVPGSPIQCSDAEKALRFELPG